VVLTIIKSIRANASKQMNDMEALKQHLDAHKGKDGWEIHDPMQGQEWAILKANDGKWYWIDYMGGSYDETTYNEVMEKARKWLDFSDNPIPTPPSVNETNKEKLFENVNGNQFKLIKTN